MCSDSLADPGGMTSLTHSLEGRARKRAVLGLHNPVLLGQGFVNFPGISLVSHSGENLSCVQSTEAAWS